MIQSIFYDVADCLHKPMRVTDQHDSILSSKIQIYFPLLRLKCKSPLDLRHHIINIVFAFSQNNRPGIQLRNREKILDKDFYSVKFLFRKISKFLNRRRTSSFFLQKSIVYIQSRKRHL